MYFVCVRKSYSNHLCGVSWRRMSFDTIWRTERWFIKGVLSFEERLRHVHGALCEKKDAYTATCAQLKSCKAQSSEGRVKTVHNDGNATEKEQEEASLDVTGEGIQVNTSATDEDSSEFRVENMDNEVGTISEEETEEGADEDAGEGVHKTSHVVDREEGIATPTPEKEMRSRGCNEVCDVRGGDVKVGDEERGSSSCIVKHLKRTARPRRAAPSRLSLYTNPRRRCLMRQWRLMSAVRDKGRQGWASSKGAAAASANDETIIDSSGLGNDMVPLQAVRAYLTATMSVIELKILKDLRAKCKKFKEGIEEW
ncbi:hypothetical protein Cgig2_000360 [Carnegiea gigantea]|uniref:Uncharacterized protein n=1 Tax=Carnegiea gigantea TaxID=171969 RepID=A0A9Q1QBZ6_9CARY|nr:hypothetical protein Cgig2_000360 [Carnegiea gigantea]